jgi:hypothetical protein
LLRYYRNPYEHFRTVRFSLSDLSRRTGEDLRVLQGLAGSLGLVCNRRGVAVFDRHGGEPLLMSVRPEVANLLAAEAEARAGV